MAVDRVSAFRRIVVSLCYDRTPFECAASYDHWYRGGEWTVRSVAANNAARSRLLIAVPAGSGLWSVSQQEPLCLPDGDGVGARAGVACRRWGSAATSAPLFSRVTADLDTT